MGSLKYDFVVVGSGLAGLAFALKVDPKFSVAIITKDRLQATNTSWAQGGIAAVTESTDSFEDHIRDTLIAGAGLCRADIVSNYIHQAPERVKELVNWGVHFDSNSEGSGPDLTREGGHSHRRILHFEDHTGAEIHRALLNQCQQRSNIHFFENHMAVDLILNRHLQPSSTDSAQVVGMYVLEKNSGQVLVIQSKVTVLSTGGAGKVYLYTSNWSGATGDGIAMAFRAGARVANLEFMQFHPTCLYHPEARNFLISEALRGEGGELVDSKGNAFMKKYHALGSLAPRDIVARGIDAEMKKSGEPCVYLDMRHLSREKLKSRFPVIFQKCLDYGIDMSERPIPVVPAAHYLCGGVLTDINGQTDIQGLYAIGETACSGLHGANRLASNSLLECLAMAHNAFIDTHQKIESIPWPEQQPAPWIHPAFTDQDEMSVINHMWDEIRRLMWNYVGIVRSNKRLERASHRLDNILSEVRDYYSNFKIHPDIVELRNIALVAHLSVQCALKRKESRGIHYNLDYPWADWKENDQSQGRALDSIVSRNWSRY
jgi:L-aspartate oxidase